MIGKTIPVSDANIMIQEYIKYTQNPVDMSTQTQSVSFSSSELKAWLDQITPKTDEMRVCFGMYPAGHAKAGRLTVIIWPYKDGKPTRTNPEDPPYNDGQGKP